MGCGNLLAASVVALRAHAKELNTGHLFPCIFPLYNDLAEDLAGKIWIEQNGLMI